MWHKILKSPQPENNPLVTRKPLRVPRLGVESQLCSILRNSSNVCSAASHLWGWFTLQGKQGLWKHLVFVGALLIFLCGRGRLLSSSSRAKPCRLPMIWNSPYSSSEIMFVKPPKVSSLCRKPAVICVFSLFSPTFRLVVLDLMKQQHPTGSIWLMM